MKVYSRSRKTKTRMIVEGDRLSMLPDDLIHRILSLISIKCAVRTSSLSSRWRFTWTSMPYLNISIDDFWDSSNLVNHVLSRRNDGTEVNCVKLAFHKRFNGELFKRILDYAFSHNVQQLTVTYMVDVLTEFTLYPLDSQSLKDLRLTGYTSSVFHPSSIVLDSSTWELPALTTLRLDNITFSEDNEEEGIDLFSECPNLKNLTLTHFAMLLSSSVTVCHPQLSNLTLEDGFWTLNVVNVVAPQLENLTIRNCCCKHLITAPNLVSLVLNSSHLLVEFFTDLPSLEKVDLCIHSTHEWSDRAIVGLLQRIRNVKFLTLNLEFLEPLSSYMEQISPQPSPFSNLRSLKIYPAFVPLNEAYKQVHLSAKVINYLLDGSPSAIFTMISYEEVVKRQQEALALENATAAENLMANLQATLEQEKADIERDKDQKAPMEADTDDAKGKAQVEKMQVQFERKMRQMKSFWEDMGRQIDRGGRDTCHILSQLRDIEVLLLKELPASKKDKLQACYSSLCAEVNTVVTKILDRMKTPQIQLFNCFNKLATTSLLSS